MPELPQDLVHTIDCKQSAVRAVRFTVDGHYCLTCGSDKTLKLWNPHRNIVLKTYTGHGYEVLDAQASCDNSQLVSCGMDKSVILWDVSSGQVLRKFRGHVGRVNCVKFNEESTVIVSGSLDGSIRTWDLKSRKNDPIQILHEAKDSVTSVQVSEHEILSGSVDGHIRRYDLRMGQLYSDNIGSAITSVSFTRDGQCILVGCMDSTVKLMDKDSGEMLSEYVGHRNKDYKIDSCLSATDAEVISGSEDGSVYIWDLVTSSVVAKLKHPKSTTVHSVSYHPSVCCLLTATEGKVYVWKSKELIELEPKDVKEDTKDDTQAAAIT